jgi:peptidoglycan L-alanyl-D-glutamate endopeptidase CwlK
MTDATLAALRIRHLGFLAPAMRIKVQHVVERMEAQGFDPLVFETLRLPQVQAEYARRGTSKQRDVLRSMHGHGLAVDIVSLTTYWSAPKAFWDALGEAARAEGLAWGGDWKSFKDLPHIQWGKYPGVVPNALVEAFNRGGLYASWEEAGAL